MRFRFCGHAGNAPAGGRGHVSGNARTAAAQPGAAPIHEAIRTSTASAFRLPLQRPPGIGMFHAHVPKQNEVQFPSQIRFVCKSHAATAFKWPSATGFRRFHFVIFAAFDRLM